MKKEVKRYTLIISPELLAKFHFVAEYEGRSVNRELERYIKLRIAKFEKEIGKIELLD